LSEPRDLRYVSLLALAAALILIVGTWLKPSQQRAESTVPTGPPLPSQAERQRLDRLSQQGQLERTSAYFSQIAFDVASQLVWLELGASGLIWDASGVVVTSSLPKQFPETALADIGAARSSSLRTQGAPPDLPAAVLRASGPLLSAVQPAEDFDLQTGEWVLAVWRTPERRYAFAPGLYLGVTSTRCGDYRFDELTISVPLTDVMAGGGIFDQQGLLLAAILRCEDRYVAMTGRSVEATIAEAVSLEGRLLTRFGLGVAVLHDAEQGYFDVEAGVLVGEVWIGYAADEAGVRPGDVIVGVGDDETLTIDNLAPLVDTESATLRLAILRRGRATAITLPGTLVQAPAEGRPTGAGRSWALEAADQSVRIEWVAPGTRAEAAGVLAGDLLLELDQAPPRSATAVRRVLSDQSAAPAFLVLQRGPRVWGVMLE